MNGRQQEKLQSLLSQPVQWQCRLDRYTSFSIGGPAEALVRVERRRELLDLLIFLTKEQVPWQVIGRGTNLLVRDEGFAGVIIILVGEFKSVEKHLTGDADTVIVRAGAGHSLGKVVSSCVDWGLTGIEFGCGIPGTIGGAVIMNAGAWGNEIASIVESVQMVTAEGERWLDRRSLDFSYRCWNGFAEYRGTAVVSEVELKLTYGDPDTIRQDCRLLQARRKQKQPSGQPNAGSFFKNPEGDSAGRLIEASGLKGLTIGGAMISPHHGNFLVNRGGATAEDVLKLMEVVQVKVRNDSAIDLEPEVHFI